MAGSPTGNLWNIRVQTTTGTRRAWTANRPKEWFADEDCLRVFVALCLRLVGVSLSVLSDSSAGGPLGWYLGRSVTRHASADHHGQKPDGPPPAGNQRRRT